MTCAWKITRFAFGGYSPAFVRRFDHAGVRRRKGGSGGSVFSSHRRFRVRGNRVLCECGDGLPGWGLDEIQDGSWMCCEYGDGLLWGLRDYAGRI